MNDSQHSPRSFDHVSSEVNGSESCEPRSWWRRWFGYTGEGTADDQAYRDVELAFLNNNDFVDVQPWSVLTGLIGPAFGLVAAPLVFLFVSMVPMSFFMVLGAKGLAVSALEWTVFPCTVMAAMVILVPIIWDVGLLWRFAVSAGVYLPAVLWMGFFIPDQSQHDGFWQRVFQVAPIVIPSYLFVVVVGSAIRLWSPWALAHRRHAAKTIAPTSTRMLLELMTVASLVFAFCTLLDFSQLTAALIVLVAVGLASLGLLCAMFGGLTERPQTRFWLIIAVIPSALISGGFLAVVAIANGNTSYLSFYPAASATVFVHGTACMLFCVWMGARWLERSGWKLVRKVGAAETTDERVDQESVTA